MRNNPITADFTKKFRQEQIAYPGAGEKQYSNFLFRQFAGNQMEPAIIDISLSKIMSEEKIIIRLFEKLKKQDLPGFAQLLSFMQGFQKKVAHYAKKEPYTSQYYRRLLPFLEQCTSLVNSFYQIQKDMASKLKIHIHNKSNSDNTNCINSRDIDIMLSGIERYSRQVQKYFYYFNDLLQRESENCQRISVTSRIEQYFLQMVNLIERVVLDATETTSRLGKWQRNLIIREIQELYN